MSKAQHGFDMAFLESELKGKTLLVYWYLTQQPTHTVGIREVQRALDFSSPSIAVHHLEKLRDLGLVTEKGTGEYVLEEEVKNTVQSAYQHPLPQTRPDEDRDSQNLKERDKPLSIDELTEILGSTVRHDDVSKAITFLTMLLTYTEEDQINLGFLAESSTGKSYIPLELSWYFPKEDVLKTGYTSPTAFFHDWGTLLPDPGDQRDVEDDKKRKITHIDLYQKILIFLDQPHDQLLQRLRSLLSHDEKQIIVKITDRSQDREQRTLS